MKKLVSIDLSMRSAGLVCLDENGRLEDQLLIPTQKTNDFDDDENLIRYMSSTILGFSQRHTPTAFAQEGLSFGSSSGRTDLIAANWWYTRILLKDYFPDALFGSVPVLSWQSQTLDLKKAGRALLKETYGKDYLKKAVCALLPPSVEVTFKEYLGNFEWPKGYENAKKKTALWDLADAYFMGQYRLRIGAI